APALLYRAGFCFRGFARHGWESETYGHHEISQQPRSFRPSHFSDFAYRDYLAKSIRLSSIWAASDQYRTSAASSKLHLRFPGEQPRPLSMVAGDFDEDGIGDLVIGYSLQKGGAIQLLRGNPDAFAPKAYQSGMAAGRHQFSDPYLQTARLVSTTTQPRLMISAELNGDGHLDLVYAARGN